MADSSFCAHFYSDLHIKSMSDARAPIFLKALNESFGRITHLFLLGDIFDLWIGSGPYFYRRYQPIADKILELKRSGVDVHVFEGNHDIHITQFWLGQNGVSVHTGPFEFTLGDSLIRLEHGDEMNPEDVGYHRLRWFLRTPPLRFLAGTLPGEFIASFADPWSSHSRKATVAFDPKRDQSIRMMMNRHAEKIARDSRADILITGHTHVREDVVVTSGPSRGLRHVNLGSWYDRPTYFELTSTGSRFVEI